MTNTAAYRQKTALKKGTFQNGDVITISLGHLLHDIYTSFPAPLLPFLIDKFNITLFTAGLMDIALRASSVLYPFVGVVADRMSIRYCIITAPAISAVTMSLLGSAPCYPMVLILLFFAGVNSVFYHVPSPVMVKQVSGEKTGRGMSFYMFGGEMARTLGPLLITAAVSLWGLEGSWRVMPLGIVASVILFYKLRKIPVRDRYREENAKTGFKKTIKKYIPLFFTIGAYTFFRAGVKSGLALYLAKYLANKGASVWVQGISVSMLQMGGAAGTLLAGFVSERIGRRNTLLIAGVANPLLMWLFVYSDTTVMIPVLVLMGFFLFAPGPVLLAIVQDTDSGRPSFINSVYMTISFSIGSLMVLFVGFLGDVIGLESTFKICAVAAFLSIPFILKLHSIQSSLKQ